MAKEKDVSKRGSITQGVVVSDKNKRTVIVQRDLVIYVPKFKRYARKISRIAAHNPDEIGAAIGDVVEISECRKVSKTKAWIVTKIVQKGEGHIKMGQVKATDELQRSSRERKQEQTPATKKVEEESEVPEAVEGE